MGKMGKKGEEAEQDVAMEVGELAMGDEEREE